MHDAAAGTAWYRRYGGRGIRVPRYLHRATVRAPSVIPHTAWDHPSRAEACGGSDGVVARERKGTVTFPCPVRQKGQDRIGQPAGSSKLWASPSTGIPDSRCSRVSGVGGDRHASVQSFFSFPPFLITSDGSTDGQEWRTPVGSLQKPWAWRTLGRGSDCNVPDSHPMSYPASHLMAPPLQRSPETVSGSAQLPTYFPLRFSRQWCFRLKPRSRPDQLLGTVLYDDHLPVFTSGITAFAPARRQVGNRETLVTRCWMECFERTRSWSSLPSERPGLSAATSDKFSMCAYFARLEVSSIIYLSLPSRQTSHGDDEMKDMLADLQAVSQRRRTWRAGGQAGWQAGKYEKSDVQGFSRLDAREQSEGTEAGKQNRTRQMTLARMRQILHIVFPPEQECAFITRGPKTAAYTQAGRT